MASSRLAARNPALDGLRGVAVAAVVVNHLRPHALPGGWLGVDIFFVLSGYLITTLLLREHEQRGRLDLGRFYSRRARRLLPALFLLLGVVAVVARFSPDEPGFTGLRGDGFAALGYVANWRFIATGASYFNTFAPSPLRHLWSLAVEEQFYLLWPLVLILVLRRHGPRAVGVTAVVLALASATAMAVMYGSGAHISRIYFGTDTHAHSVLIGCALAAIGPRPAAPAGRRRRGAARGCRHRVRVRPAVGNRPDRVPRRNRRGEPVHRGRDRGGHDTGRRRTRRPCVLVEAAPRPRADLVRRVLVALAGDRVPEREPHRRVGRRADRDPGRHHARDRDRVVPAARTTGARGLAAHAMDVGRCHRGVGRRRARSPRLAFVVPRAEAPFAAAEQAARVRSAKTATFRTPATKRTGPRRVVVVGDSVAYTLFPGLRASERRRISSS